MNEKLESLNQLNNLTATFQKQMTKIKSVILDTQDLTTLKADVTSIKNYLDTVETKLGTLENDVEVLKPLLEKIVTTDHMSDWITVSSWSGEQDAGDQAKSLNLSEQDLSLEAGVNWQPLQLIVVLEYDDGGVWKNDASIDVLVSVTWPAINCVITDAIQTDGTSDGKIYPLRKIFGSDIVYESTYDNVTYLGHYFPNDGIDCILHEVTDRLQFYIQYDEVNGRDYRVRVKALYRAYQS
jgi:hypothetical protein